MIESLELRPSLVDLARTDTDLDAIRDGPRFAELVGTQVVGSS